MKKPYFIVAIYWPNEGYSGGASQHFATLEEAKEYAAKDTRCGYGRKKNPIHVIKVHPNEIIYVIDDELDTKNGRCRDCEEPIGNKHKTRCPLNKTEGVVK